MQNSKVIARTREVESGMVAVNGATTGFSEIADLVNSVSGQVWTIKYRKESYHGGIYYELWTDFGSWSRN